MDDKERVAEIISRLKQKYPFAPCSLKFDGEPYKLLIMSRLSAQCTDARVNKVCETLFVEFPTLQSFADCEVENLERAIFSCGLYKTKARDIKAMCQKLISDFDGIVPSAMEDLLSLPGIGRKIANLIRGDLFLLPAIVADTHCIRISNRLGLCSSKDPRKVESTLSAIIPRDESNDFCHRLVFHGRETCRAQSPLCHLCVLYNVCPVAAGQGMATK